MKTSIVLGYAWFYIVYIAVLPIRVAVALSHAVCSLLASGFETAADHLVGWKESISVFTHKIAPFMLAKQYEKLWKDASDERKAFMMKKLNEFATEVKS